MFLCYNFYIIFSIRMKFELYSYKYEEKSY